MRRLVLYAIGVVLVACGQNGPPAPGQTTVTVGGNVYDYSGFVWGANNDCGTSPGVISVTIRGPQTGSPDHGLGLCLPRPDLISSSAIDLGDAARVVLAGLNGTLAGCDITMPLGAATSGTVTFDGFSTASGSAYQMIFAATVEGTSSCADGPVSLVLAGTAGVTAQ